MSPTTPIAPYLQPEIESEDDKAPSCWFLIEVEENTEAEDILVGLLAATLIDAVSGLRYSARCVARSLPEAIVEFACVGGCERSVYWRLVMRQIL
jgi:hypothetical protein